MKLAKGNLFQLPCDALCITTNGFVKANGECVMGKGCAKQLVTYYPQAPRLLGQRIKQNGNVVQCFMHAGVPIIAFPVKPISAVFDGTNAVAHMAIKFKLGDTIPGWACKADINIIIESANQLRAIADRDNLTNIILPYAGCGAGELDWTDVYPILNSILDDRFTAVTY